MTTWGDEPPAGDARNAERTAPAGFQGDEFRRKVRAAQAGWNAALRRRTRRPRGGRYQAGMARRMPDGPPDDAA